MKHFSLFLIFSGFSALGALPGCTTLPAFEAECTTGTCDTSSSLQLSIESVEKPGEGCDRCVYLGPMNYVIRLDDSEGNPDTKHSIRLFTDTQLSGAEYTLDNGQSYTFDISAETMRLMNAANYPDDYSYSVQFASLYAVIDEATKPVYLELTREEMWESLKNEQQDAVFRQIDLSDVNYVKPEILRLDVETYRKPRPATEEHQDAVHLRMFFKASNFYWQDGTFSYDFYARQDDSSEWIFQAEMQGLRTSSDMYIFSEDMLDVFSDFSIRLELKSYGPHELSGAYEFDMISNGEGATEASQESMRFLP